MGQAGCGVFVGLTSLDMVHFLPSAPGRNEKVFDQGSFVGAGGPASNAAITFAALGGRAHLFSAVGEHPVSSMITTEFRKFGVSHQDTDPGRSTPPSIASIVVSTENGDRSVVTSQAPPSNQPESLEQVQLHEDLEILLSDGHDLHLAMHAVRSAKERGATAVLDGGSWKPGTEHLLPYVDDAIVSERFRPPGTHHSDEVLDFLQKAGVSRAAITRGEREILFFNAAGATGQIEVPKIQAVDTLAAGDIFHGAYCHAIHRGLDFEPALEYAASIAGRSCGHLGPRAWIDNCTL